MKKPKPVTFAEFLSFFPEAELPVNLSEEMIHDLSAINKVLPRQVLEEYILKWEKEMDEFTEFVPCFSIRGNQDFIAIVYWKGELLKYEYVIVTLTLEGDLIAKKKIASTLTSGKTVKRSVAHIDEDLIIHIVAGESQSETDYDAKRSQAFNMEIIPTGDIIFSLGND